MRIIISPAKKMRIDDNFIDNITNSKFIKETQILLDYLKSLRYQEAKELWKSSDKIAQLNYERVHKMDLQSNPSQAIFSFEGIQYQYMAPGVFTVEELHYIQEHLLILSGFYGILKPFDGVSPYRLEMQAKIKLGEYSSLYEFWKDKIAKELFSQSKCILNLASKEYSRCIPDYLKEDVRFVTCSFGEFNGEKLIEKGTKVIMARGEMVRFMAENQIKDIEEIKNFKGLNYTFSEELSTKDLFIFIS
ncbi:MAG: peroxide stress protein YaaA [Tissierella sp.]|nr:peroxide stress protein YaaA [Tissierella sp.]